jgi:hypothetical protein
MTENPRRWWLALVPWLVLGLGEIYLALGFAGLPVWRLLLGEFALLLVVGAATARALPSFPGLSTTIVPAIPLASALLAQLPTGLGAVPAVVGVLVLLGAPVVPLIRGRGLPWWAATILVVPALLLAHVVQSAGIDMPAPSTLRARLARDLSWPARMRWLPDAKDGGAPVIVISVDTLRADRARQMRTWQRLAERGAWWDSAMSTSSWTLPALASLQTGLMPGDHGAGLLEHDRFQGIAAGVPTLAEQLAARGYANVAVMTNPWAGTVGGLERGFHAFADLANDAPRQLALLGLSHSGVAHQGAEVAVPLAISWLDRLASLPSFYLWVHLLDPHLPYGHSADPMLASLTVDRARMLGVMSPESRAKILAAYDAEVSATDRQLELLLDRMEAGGLLDRAVVVFTSDHGEELFDHGSFEHGHSHHGEVVEVPLVIVAPGLAPGRREGVASLLDVPSTIRAAVGLEPGGVDLAQPTGADRIVTAQGNLHIAAGCSARSSARRVLVEDCGYEQPRIRRYDLALDPEERFALRPDPQDPVEQAAVAVKAPEPGDTVDARTGALRALGYVD